MDAEPKAGLLSEKAFDMATLFVGDPTKPVVPVSRRPDLDIFVGGGDGNILTAWWAPGMTEWGGPTLINTDNSLIPSGNPFFSAVSRSQDKLDIFTTDYRGNIVTTAWPDPTHASPSGWSIWRQVAQGVTVSNGSYVSAVSRSTDKLDIFVGGLGFYLDGIDENVPALGGTDHGLGTGIELDAVAVGGGRRDSLSWIPVTAISRSTDLIDTFATDQDATVQTAAWAPDGRDWRGWWTA